MEGLPKSQRFDTILVWITDETQSTNLYVNVCRLDKVSTYQVIEQEMIMVMIVMTTR